MATKETMLQGMTDRINKTAKCYGMEMNVGALR